MTPRPTPSRRGRLPADRRSFSKPGYLAESRKPLTVLLFVCPLVIAYELAVTASTFDDLPGIAARGVLARFFDLFGVAGVHVPAIALVVSLLAAHVLRGDRWKLRPLVAFGIAVEGAALAIPLLVLSAIAGGGAAAALTQTAAAEPGSAASWRDAVALAIGAGLYEETVFRLLGFAVLGLVLEDVIGLKKGTWTIIAVIVTSLAFAAFHGMPGSGGISVPRFILYALAGVYFAILYVLRGFGVAVGAHTVYDIVALMPAVMSE
ncbi:MAG: CPBP family intramembrane glutamic endopeptidase [Planctomycetota bacterium]